MLSDIIAEQRRLRADLSTFISQQKASARERKLSSDHFMAEFWGGLAAKRWLGLNLPSRYGGGDRPYVESAAFIEELAYRNTPGMLRAWFDSNFGFVTPTINRYGSEYLKNRFLPKVCRGELNFSLCLTDAEGGSDVAGLSTRAADDGDHFVVNGTKLYSDSLYTDWTCLIARTGTDESRERGLSVMLVDLKSPGVQVRPLPFIWGAHRAEVVFDNARIPKENLVGVKDNGWEYVVNGIAGDWRAVGQVGLLQRDFERFVMAARTLERDGRSVLKLETVRHRLTDLATEIEVARNLFYYSFWVIDRGMRGLAEAATTRIYTTELWERFYNALIEISGSQGLLQPSGSHRFPLLDLGLPVQYSFAPAIRIGGWPVEVSKGLVAKEALGLPTEISDYRTDSSDLSVAKSTEKESLKALRHIMRRAFEAEYPAARARQLDDNGDDYDVDFYRLMGEMGWLGLLLPTEYGGAEGEWADCAVFYEECGRALLRSPHFSTVVLAGQLLSSFGSARQKADVIPGITNGDTIIACAVPRALAGITATRSAGGYVLTGAAPFVPYAHIADYIVTAARLDRGIGLFLVPAPADGLSCVPISALGGAKLCNLEFQAISLPEEALLGSRPIGVGRPARLLNRARLMLCAEMLGACDKVMEITVTYCKQRVVFRRPIGAHQSPQHRLVDMQIAVDGLRRLVYRAVDLADRGEACDRESLMAQVQAGRTYAWVTRNAVHLSGTVSLAKEHDLSLYYIRSKYAQLTLDDATDLSGSLAKVIGI